jgi:Rrf2 family protein
MLKITKKGDYGLIFLTSLAQKSKRTYVPLKMISKENNLPYKFISQIALHLKSAGLVKSKEGLGGGYQLNQPANKINLAKILEILEGPVAPVACMRGKRCLNQDTCKHRTVMENLAVVIRKNLAKQTLADFVKKV